MELKNYVVKCKNVNYDSFVKYINYLYSNDTKSHSNTNIINIENKTKEIFISDIIDLKAQNEKNYILNGKGGKKLQRIFKSLTFNIPKEYECNSQQLESIGEQLNEMIINHLKTMHISIDKKHLLSVGHNQSNNHIHTLIPTLNAFGENIRYLNEKKFTNILKVHFSDIVDNELKKDIKKYKVEKSKEEYQIEKETIIKNDFINQKTINELEALKKTFLKEKNITYINTTITLIKRYEKENRLATKYAQKKNIEKRISKMKKNISPLI